MVTPLSFTGLLADLIEILIVLIIVEVIVANIIAFTRWISPYHPMVRLLRKIVDPILDPVRRVLPPRQTGGWDLSPLIVIILLQMLRSLFYH